MTGDERSADRGPRGPDGADVGDGGALEVTDPRTRSLTPGSRAPAQSSRAPSAEETLAGGAPTSTPASAWGLASTAAHAASAPPSSEDTVFEASASAPRRQSHTPGGGPPEWDAQRPADDPRATAASIGRYLLLEPVRIDGESWRVRCYDPQLDRPVDLLGVRAEAKGETGQEDEAEAPMQAARILAALDHPGLARVHDIGESREGVWIAAEVRPGVPFSTWAARPRRWAEIVSVLTPVSEALALVHERGFVHARLGVEDLRVARGGAACLSGIHPRLASRVGGGEAAEVAASRARDVSALVAVAIACAHREIPRARAPGGDGPDAVAEGIRRAHAHVGDLPRWLSGPFHAALATAADPAATAARTLHGGLRAAHARRRRRQWIGAVGVVALIAGVFFGQRAVSAQVTVLACSRERDATATLWNPEVSNRLVTALRATDVPWVETAVARVPQLVDAWFRADGDARELACRNHAITRIWGDEIYARSEDCFRERRAVVAALLEELLAADVEVATRSIAAVLALPASTTCTEEAVLRRRPTAATDAAEDIQAARDHLSRAEAAEYAGHYDGALEGLAQARRLAEAVSWRPLDAQVALRRGVVLSRIGRYAEAEAALEAAYFSGRASHSAEVAVDAAIALADCVGYRQARTADGGRWARIAAITREDLEGESDETHRGSTLAVVRGLQAYIAGDHELALTHYARGRDIRLRLLGEDHPDTARSVGNVAAAQLGLGQYDAAVAGFLHAVELLERALGAEHVEVAVARSNLGAVYQALGQLDAARSEFERAHAISLAALGPFHPNLAASHNNLGANAEFSGEHARAVTHYEAALAIWEHVHGDAHPDVAMALNNLANARLGSGEPAAALPLYARALAIRQATLPGDHIDIADTLNNYSVAAESAGDLRLALDLHRRSVELKRRILSVDHPSLTQGEIRLSDLLARVQALSSAPSSGLRSLGSLSGAPAED